MTGPIVVVGSINLDLVVHSTRVPVEGETVTGSSFPTSHGGKGANQAVGVARLGQPVAMIGCVGQDTFGHELHDALAASGVDTEAVRAVPGSSGIAVIQVEPSGANRITVVPGANAALTPTTIEEHRALVVRAAMVLTQLETPPATVEALAAACDAANVPLMLDPAPAQALSGELLRRTTWLTPNVSEALTLLQLTSAPPADAAEAIALARRLQALGCRSVLLKLGELGAVAILGRDEPLYQPAFPVRVVDTTAAGDSTNAAFATALVRGLATTDALRYACAAAALCVARSGAQQAMPSHAEIDTLLRHS